MKYNPLTKIETIADVERFVKYVYEELEVNFHPDDDFNDIINHESGKKTFTDNEANLYNKLVEDCFRVCEEENVDFYEIAYKYHPVLHE